MFCCMELSLFAFALSSVFALSYRVDHVEVREQNVEWQSPSRPLEGESKSVRGGQQRTAVQTARHHC